jgi:hypothetical protein
MASVRSFGMVLSKTQWMAVDGFLRLAFLHVRSKLALIWSPLSKLTRCIVRRQVLLQQVALARSLSVC